MNNVQDTWASPIKSVATALTALGALPFIIFSVLLHTHFSVARVEVIEDLLTSYGVLIATFIAGSHWGNTLRRSENEAASSVRRAEYKSQIHCRKDSEKISSMVLLLSNGLTLVLWLAWASFEFRPLLACLIAILPLLLWIDTCLYRTSRIHQGYLKLRAAISAVVVVSLGFALIA